MEKYLRNNFLQTSTEKVSEWKLLSWKSLRLFAKHDCSLPGSFIHGSLQAKNTRVGWHFLLQNGLPSPKWVAISFLQKKINIHFLEGIKDFRKSFRFSHIFSKPPVFRWTDSKIIIRKSERNAEIIHCGYIFLINGISITPPRKEQNSPPHQHWDYKHQSTAEPVWDSGTDSSHNWRPCDLEQTLQSILC